MTITKESEAVILRLDRDEFASLLFLTGFATGTAMKDKDRETVEALRPFSRSLYNVVKKVDWGSKT